MCWGGAGDITISSCTIVSNSAIGSGGGTRTAQSNSRAEQIEDSIIYFNRSGDSSSNYSIGTGPTTLFTNCCTSPAFPAGVTNANTITNNPQFMNWTASDYRLDRNSPCVNAGVNRDWMPGDVDLDGRNRIDKFSGIVDIGCFEYVPNGTMYGFR